ncbi:MAG: ankyrin repeat domain-containing protein [Nannocystaceae bacterium]|nr:ankyrin repeat domain-containing protein [Nannocystaceae bacterium]
MLIERGADLEAKDSDGKTGWDLVWGNGKRNLTKPQACCSRLIDGGFSPPVLELPKGRRLLHAVARRVPSARLVQVLVEDHGRAVDAADDDGWTSLHVAIHKNNSQAATGLLAQDADANAETSHGVGRRSNRTGEGVRRWRFPAGSRPPGPLFEHAWAARGRCSRGYAAIRWDEEPRSEEQTALKTGGSWVLTTCDKSRWGDLVAGSRSVASRAGVHGLPRGNALA